MNTQLHKIITHYCEEPEDTSDLAERQQEIEERLKTAVEHVLTDAIYNQDGAAVELICEKYNADFHGWVSEKMDGENWLSRLMYRFFTGQSSNRADAAMHIAINLVESFDFTDAVDAEIAYEDELAAEKEAGI